MIVFVREVVYLVPAAVRGKEHGRVRTARSDGSCPALKLSTKDSGRNN